MRLLITLVLLIVGEVAQAKPVEVWECKDVFASWDTILVTATVEDGRQKGNIYVAGVTYVADFQVAGFDRRWDFGARPKSGYQYAFIIEPNGGASYYDFGNENSAKPKNVMTCREKNIVKAPN